MKRALPWLVMSLVLWGMAIQLRFQGRLWVCGCGYVLPWSGNINSSDNSQHLFDPYTLTHIVHGFMFAGLVALLLYRWPESWRFVIVIFLEAVWEIIENTSFVINRYRTATISLGYTGDTILNSLGDIAACGLGAILAFQLGLKRTLLLLVANEAVLLLWIRDSLILNVVMLIHPVEAIRLWQAGH